MDPAPKRFVKGIERLAVDGDKVVITMCNSGGRSTACIAKIVTDDLAKRFKAFYEIDAPGDQYLHPKHRTHLAGFGGFQGPVYGSVYHGFSGFTGRPSAMQSVQGWKQGVPNGPSVSWKESGLPVYIPEITCNLPDMPRTP